MRAKEMLREESGWRSTQNGQFQGCARLTSADMLRCVLSAGTPEALLAAKHAGQHQQNLVTYSGLE
jgi:hypothetical protein